MKQYRDLKLDSELYEEDYFDFEEDFDEYEVDEIMEVN